MNAATIFAAFGAIAAVLAIGAAVVIGLRGKALSADLAIVRARLKDADDELERKDRRLHDAEVKIVHLEESDAAKSAALARIGEQAASGADMRELADALREASGLARDHDREAAARHAGTLRALREIRNEQAEVKAALVARNEEGDQ